MCPGDDGSKQSRRQALTQETNEKRVGKTQEIHFQKPTKNSQNLSCILL